jgi:hypothetical protein
MYLVNKFRMAMILSIFMKGSQNTNLSFHHRENLRPLWMSNQMFCEIHCWVITKLSSQTRLLHFWSLCCNHKSISYNLHPLVSSPSCVSRYSPICEIYKRPDLKMKIKLSSKLWTDNLLLCCQPFYIGNGR